MKLRNILPEKKGQGVVTGLIGGIGGLIILVIIILVITTTILGANLLSADTTANATAYSMQGNFTEGINSVSSKLPTILLIGAVVILLAVLGLLLRNSNVAGLGSGGGSL